MCLLCCDFKFVRIYSLPGNEWKTLLTMRINSASAVTASLFSIQVLDGFPKHG